MRLGDMVPENTPPTVSHPAPGRQRDEDLQDAIDRIFAEFELLFPQQFKNAYDSQEKLGHAKLLWYQILKKQRPNQVRLLHAARTAAVGTKFLPTIREVLEKYEDLPLPPPLSLPPAEKPLNREGILRAIAATRKLIRKK